ncbi:MAG: SGNH/GDSL hydrolase family protein [Pseudonocardiaceae bacterium]
MLGPLRTMAVLVGAGGAMAGAAYGMLNRQGQRARRTLAIPDWVPFNADGVYLPDGTGPLPPSAPTGDVLCFTVLGDSSAAGLGVDRPDELPGVVLARGLAEEAGQPVRLDTLAICGSTTRGLSGQVDAALVGPPEAVLIMIGSNDVLRRMPPGRSATLLGDAVARLRTAGTAVVVGTCPDLGSIQAIPQPLRAIARTWSLALARLQRAAVLPAGGLPVPIADLLAPEFSTQPALFSRDHFHPSTAGYDAACSVLLPALCSVLGVWGGRPVPQPRGLSTGVHATVATEHCADATEHCADAASADTAAAPSGWSNWATAALDRGMRRVRAQALGVRP